MNVVFYHYPCPDGVFGALAAHLHFKHTGAPVRYVPMTVTSKVEDRIAAAKTLTKADTAYIVDFSGGIPFLTACCDAAKEVRLIDHHKTAAEELPGMPESTRANFFPTFDMARSGAQLAFDVLGVAAALPALGYTAADAERIATLVCYIQDNDLWLHKLPDSKTFTAGFHAICESDKAAYEYDADKNPGIFDKLLALQPAAVIEAGRAAEAARDAIIAGELATAFAIAIPVPGAPEPFKCLAVVTAYPDYRSVQGNQLCGLSAGKGLLSAGAVVYGEAAIGADQVKVSLRSTGGLDTTPASKAYGGGGHAAASSFVVAKAVFDTWRV